MTSGEPPAVQAGSSGFLQSDLARSRWATNPSIRPPSTSATAFTSPCGPPPLTSAVSWYGRTHRPAGFGMHACGFPPAIAIPFAPGKVPKYVSNDLFSCITMITCLILWMPAGTTYARPGLLLTCPGGLTEEEEGEVQAASRAAAAAPEDMTASKAFLRRMSSTIWLPDERLGCLLDGLGQVVPARRPVQRAAAVGQQLAHQRDAAGRDRAPGREALGQPGQLGRRPRYPVPAERDVRVDGAAGRSRRGHRERAWSRGHGRREHPSQARSQGPAVPGGRQDHGPRGQDRASLRPGPGGQLAVQARRQYPGQQPVPGRHPPEGQAAEIVVEQDMHRMSPPTT